MMMDIEHKRQQLQNELDLAQSQDIRNVLGQFSTPYPLAHDIMSYLYTLVDNNAEVSFLEPAIGTGVFYSALLSVWGKFPKRALGFEIDSHYSIPAQNLWNRTNLQIINDDFLNYPLQAKQFSLLISNPPYSRHHHISYQSKQKLQKMVYEATGIKISGLAGLYCYFIMLSTQWLKPSAVSCWLIPSEFMEVNFGEALKRFLLENVNLLRIHRFQPEDLQFSDALVTSSIVVFKNEPPQKGTILFSEGGKITAPNIIRNINYEALSPNRKWTHINIKDDVNTVKLGNYFDVKRGLATGSNDFFIIAQDIVDKYEIPSAFLIPILSSPKAIREDVIESDSSGVPLLTERRYLFSCDVPEDEIKEKYPKLWSYIQEGVAQGISERYICSRRTPWYYCEKRTPAPFLVNYMGRDSTRRKAFRFILNNSQALATNVFLLLYPKPFIQRNLKDSAVLKEILHALNKIPSEAIMRCGRVYGGGLCKLEPKELLNIPIHEISNILGQSPSHMVQEDLFSM